MDNISINTRPTGGVLPPMIKCCECAYAFTYWDNILGKTRYACSVMQEIGQFDDFYSIVDSGCVNGLKMNKNCDNCEKSKQLRDIFDIHVDEQDCPYYECKGEKE